MAHGRKVVVHGGSRVVVAGAPVVETTVGNYVVLKDESVVFRSNIGNRSIIGERSAVVGSVLNPGTVVPPRTVVLNGVKFGNVEW